MTINALSLIHKLIRKQAFELALFLQRAEHAQVQEIRQKLSGIATLLRQHAAHEDELFAPSLASEDPEAASRMKTDHAEHEEELQSLEALVDVLAQDARAAVELLHQLHLDFNRFLGGLLEHLDREERDLAPALSRVVPSIQGLAASVSTLPEAERRDFLKDLESISTPSEWATFQEAERQLEIST
jgi:iron-sulfur cluster repair protein YtfE (RIC family)